MNPDFCKPASYVEPPDDGDAADAARYRVARDDPRFDIRIVGIGKRSGAELDAAIDAMIEARSK